MRLYFKEMPLVYKLVNAFGFGILFGGLIVGTIVSVTGYNRNVRMLKTQSEYYDKEYDSLVQKIKEKGLIIEYE